MALINAPPLAIALAIPDPDLHTFTKEASTIGMTHWKRNTAGLLAAVHARADEARTRAEDAIDALILERATVNFNRVAARAGVTKAYLYAHEDLRERIEKLRSPRVARDRRIAELEAELRRLQAEIGIRSNG